MMDIIHIQVLNSTAKISVADVNELAGTLGTLPYGTQDGNEYSNLWEELEARAEEGGDVELQCDACQTYADDDAKYCKECGAKIHRPDAVDLEIKNLNWCGDYSGDTFHKTFVKRIVPCIRGRIEAVAFLQGNDDVPPKMLGILIENGTYTKCDVDLRLHRSNDLSD